ncbi:MAG: RNA-binding protein [Bacteroidetes bacterium]|nr:RNA-binding protein [Bacteroidota bacterium]
MNIYIGNLDYKVSEAQLHELFSTYGAVSSAKIINDKFSGKSKGFGFVEMPNDDEARNAMNALNGQELNSRAMTATEARPRTEGGGGGGGGERRFNNNRRPRNDY